MGNDKFLDVLRKYWGYEDFRGVQRDIIESIAAGRDTLGLMPTGGGKSITFQVPTLAGDGLCLVITPLIALMKDQVQQLQKRNIMAIAINMSMSHEEVVVALENCIFGNYKFLYVSPERLKSPLFLTKLSRIPVTLITIDEAHCISQWGYDFRPSYLEVGKLRDAMPDVPVLALTATATPQVVDDIQLQLRFKERNVYRMSFDRKNIVYVVRKVEDIECEMLHILHNTNGSAIVYCRNREGVGRLSEIIIRDGISATSYHAGLSYEMRDKRQRDWSKGDIRVMVATNAFGMGIDKPDVRLVIHFGIPDSMESYYQEAGRAGRDGLVSYAVLLYSNTTLRNMRKRISATFPPREMIADIYEHICCYFQLAVDDGLDVSRQIDIQKFSYTFHHYPSAVINAIRILEHAGYWEFQEDPQRASRLCFTVRRDELYKLNSFDANGDNIINAILRYYGGVFTDQKFIDESFIADCCDVSPDYVYLFLKTLSARHIVDYIPVRQQPVITFKRRRVEKSKLYIPAETYDYRRDAYVDRVERMISYAQTENKCKGQQLLEYFGENINHQCGHCDVCNSKAKKKHVDNCVKEVISKIRELFENGAKEQDIMEIRKWHYPMDVLTQAVQLLLDNDEAYLEGFKLKPSD